MIIGSETSDDSHNVVPLETSEENSVIGSPSYQLSDSPTRPQLHSSRWGSRIGLHSAHDAGASIRGYDDD
jgi:hypothetical protein